MTLIEVVILAGVQCLSPVEAAEGTTIIGKVPCAALIRLDEDTGEVDFTPPSAASNRQVIAMLVKSDEAEAPAVPEPAGAPAAEGDAQDLPVTAKPQDLPETAKPQPRQKRAEKLVKTPERRKTAAAKKKRVGKRKDACGSYKAVWYTNKEGRRKYRCVRTG
jgi:hypothetical protein